jgi:hypothetical protein
VIAAVALAVAYATPAQAQEVAQFSDFFKQQEKLRRDNQRIKRGQTAAPSRNEQDDTDSPKKKKRTRTAEKPQDQDATGTTTADTPAKPPNPISREARRRTKPKPPKEEPKKPAPTESEAPSGPPAYIRAKQEPVVKALGAELARRVFSHEFTSVRQLAISRSARVVPGFECPHDPAVALTDVIPFKVQPSANSWIEGYVVGCKPRTKRSFLVILEDDKPQFAELLPGLSIADPLLQRDAVPGAQASAKTERPEGCDKAVVSDTRLAEPLTGAGRPWVELWTVDLCGTARRIEMRFTPSKEGGTRWAARLIK